MRETGRKSLLHFLKRRRDHRGSGGPVFLHAAVFCRIEWWADLLRKGEISWITFTIMGDPAAARVRPALKGSLVPPDQREPLAAPVPRGSRGRPALKGSQALLAPQAPPAAPVPRGSRVRPVPKGSQVPPDQREPLAVPAPQERFPQTAPRPSTPFRPSSLPGRALTCFPARRIQQGISPSPALSRWDWRQGIIWCPTRCPPP